MKTIVEQREAEVVRRVALENDWPGAWPKAPVRRASKAGSWVALGLVVVIVAGCLLWVMVF